MLIALYKSKKFVAIDDADWYLVEPYRWTLLSSNGKEYATGKVDGKSMLMHRLLMNGPNGIDVDHRDGDGLNNRRVNLRLATRMQNLWNRKVEFGKTGISFRDGKWQAAIHHNKQYISLGVFDTQHEAMQARDYFSVYTRQGYGGLHGVDRTGFDPMKLRPTARRLIGEA